MREIRETCGAGWITIEECPETGRIDTVWFRRTFSCTPGEQLEIRISACSRYKLYVNGTLFTYGPCKGGDGYQFFDTLNLTPMLKEGENELLAEVVSFPDVTDPGKQVGGPDWAVNLLRCAALAVIGVTSKGQNISTAASEWTCLRCCAMTTKRNFTASWLGYTETVDLSESIRPKETAGLPWGKTRRCARILASEWGETTRLPAYERPIPLMELGTPEKLTKIINGEDAVREGKITLAPHTAVSVEFDAGEETTAFPHLKGTGGKGSVIQMRYAEAYLHPDEKGKNVKDIRTPGTDGVFEGFADEIHPDGKAFDYAPFWFRTFRYLRLEIETGEEELTLELPEAVVTRYPLSPVTEVKFDESDWIDQIYQISLRTLRCCMHETYEDCPYYEQMQYTMDTRLQMLFTYRTAADTRMAKRTLYDYHASQLPNGVLQSRYPSHSHQVIPAFALHWILMLRDYFWQTGDAGEIRTYFGTVDRVLGYFRSCRGESGLVEHPGYWEFIDWVDEWQRGVPDTDGGPEACHNFLYAYVLGVAAELARAIGFTGAAADYESEKAEILRLADARFYDAEQGLYRYHPENPRSCQHAQVWAVLAGVRDEAFRRGLMINVSEHPELLPCSFPMQYYLFRAYESVGLYEKTESLWQLWKDILPQELTTIPEVPHRSRSDCHAWGALMLYEYPAKILGVQPAEPGWKTVLVKPAALYFGQADGRAAVPDGSVDVAWKLCDGSMTLALALQTELPVRVELPNGTSETVQGRGTVHSFTCPV